jgi:hypothetical protein
MANGAYFSGNIYAVSKCKRQNTEVKRNDGSTDDSQTLFRIHDRCETYPSTKLAKFAAGMPAARKAIELKLARSRKRSYPNWHIIRYFHEGLDQVYGGSCRSGQFQKSRCFWCNWSGRQCLAEIYGVPESSFVIADPKFEF